MYLLKTEHSFDSAHFLGNYEGKCSNIHGHRWCVEVEVFSKELIQSGQQTGMVVDFGYLKKAVRDLLDSYDHALIIQQNSMRAETLSCLIEDGFKVITVDFRPTAEHFAAFFFNALRNQGFSLKRVTVYETPTNSACYEE